MKPWRYALKPGSWPKILIPAVLGQSLGVVMAGTATATGVLLAIAFTVSDLVFIVLLNDWGDQEVDRIKRTMFPDGCSPKTIPDGILPARSVLLAGLAAGGVAALVGVAGVLLERPHLLWMVLLSLAAFASYTFSPLRLNYRGGGEWLEAVGVGFFLPWVNAYAVSGVLWSPVLLVLGGLIPLSFASALASGLSDEVSDRAGGKRTYTTRFGNAAARRGVEILVFGAPVAWIAAVVLEPDAVRWWMILAPAVVTFAFGARLRRASHAAVTNAFAALTTYKAHLHHAIWYSVGLLALLNLSRVFWT